MRVQSSIYFPENQEVLESYKRLHRKLEETSSVIRHEDFDENFDESIFAEAIIERLQSIPPGADSAEAFHSLIVGALEFIFWPNLIYPKKETPIHKGRKRIDVTYTNAATNGFFYRVHTSHQIASNMVIVECKNYSKDPTNPEVDQIAGRFSTNRGRLGLLLYRGVSNYELLCERCRDTANDGRGFILPLGDAQVIEYLQLIASGSRGAIDQRLESVLSKLIS